MVIKFEYNWCEYFTKCPKFPHISVGSYECDQCKLFKSIKYDSTTSYKPGDYARYFAINTGKVDCKDD